MIHARLDRLVFAAADPKAGAAGSVLSVLNHAQLNHQMHCRAGNSGWKNQRNCCAVSFASGGLPLASRQRLDSLQLPDGHFSC
jgi:hypothetical protein